ncbi:MAG TPA: hypothetical protein VKC56_05545 [Gallionellaceae bacterium]|nr:hypothetical protein [Gallionellaceae bacterium]
MGSAVPYVAMFAANAILSDMNQPAKPPTPPPPPPPPQAAKMPSVASLYGAMGGAGQAGGPGGNGKPGPGQTFLTGSSGVDPNALTLNKPTLLGE